MQGASMRERASRKNMASAKIAHEQKQKNNRNNQHTIGDRLSATCLSTFQMSCGQNKFASDIFW